MKEKILHTAFDLYRRFGIKSISMDTIAQEMCASKKTIYQWFGNKEELVEASLEEFLEQVKLPPENQTNNSVEELVNTLRLLNEQVAGVNISFFFDLEKYHATAHRKLQQFLTAELRPYLISNLKKGILQGFYRQEINPEIVARLCIANFSVVV